MIEKESIFNAFKERAHIWQEFKASYDFFPEIYNSGFLIAAILSIAGVLIVARNQIFIGAAITQASTFGISIALSILGLEAMTDATGQARQDLILNYSILAATICTIWAFVDKSFFLGILQNLKVPVSPSKESAGKGKEDITGWLFLLASAGAIVLVSKTPLGMEEVKKLTFSSIIGADASDLTVLKWLLIVELALLIPFLNVVVLTFTDRNYAMSLKIPVSFIEFVFAILMGFILGTTLKVSGTLFSFGCLILPVLIAANLSKRTRLLFLLSPAIALSTAFLGFSLGSYYDIPQAQLTVFLMALFWPLSLIYKTIFLRN
ncbi:MAG: metal ABC transporter permease [Lentisphaeraceae bacterium]|nr:metal ABC transporter permease [Lentisphaeraceae bacterium]